MQVIPMMRNESYLDRKLALPQAIDFDEPALLRNRSDQKDRVLIQIPKLSLETLEQVAPAVMIDTGDKQAIEEEAPIPVCFKPLACGHNCNGVADERKCLPCLESGCASKHYKGDIDADQLCGICYTSELGAEACSKLGCGHVFHTGCVVNLLKHRWTTAKINFAFMSCPQCNTEIDIQGVSRPIAAVLGPLNGLKQRVEQEALINAEKQGILNNERLTNKDDIYYKQP